MIRRIRWLWLPLALLVLAIGSYLAYEALQPEPLPEGLLYANGHVEGTEVRLRAQVAGQVEEMGFEEGQTVEAGRLLVQLEQEDYRTNLALAEAEREAADAEREVVQSQLAPWRHHLETAEREEQRIRRLLESQAAAQVELDAVADRVREAAGQVRQLEARYAQAEARYQVARRRVELAELQLRRTRIHAPRASTALVKAVEIGELVDNGQLVAVLVDLNRLELRVYVPQRAIGKVKLGDPARLRIDAFPDRLFEARVSRIDQRAQFTPRDVHMPDERVRVVFGVTLQADNEEGFLKPGMPADAWIKWDAAADWPSRPWVPR